MKKLFSLLVLAAFVFAGTAMFADNKTEAAVKIKRISPDANGSWINVTNGGLPTNQYIDLSRNYMTVEIESDSPIHQPSAFLGSSNTPYSYGGKATVTNTGNTMRGGKYYSTYRVKPTSNLFTAQHNGVTIFYTMKFHYYNLSTSKEESDMISIRFARA